MSAAPPPAESGPLSGGSAAGESASHDRSEDERDPVEALAEELVERVRRGESPSTDEYASRHPELAAEINELFPTLLMLEKAKRQARPPLSRQTPERLGDFRLVREVGRGGMGVVYEAVQESLGRRVALKLLPPDAELSPRAEERFRREAQAAGTLHHTNIVQVFGAGVQDGLRYLVMQFVEGRSLDEAFQAGEVPLEPRRAARIVAQIAAGLEHAHARGVLHRDVKPANVLLDRQDTVWIADFGLAKVVGDDSALTETGDVLGTLRYLPPERLEGRADARGDVYGAGLILYELLCGQRAFPAGERADLMRAIREEGPQSLSEALPGAIPRDLETIVIRAIARDPGGRYATAGALREDLERWLEDRPIAARRAGVFERTWRWCRRNRALAALTGVAAVSLLTAATVGWTGYIATHKALDAESQRRAEAELARAEAEVATRRAEENERLSLTALEGIFDALAGDRLSAGPERGRRPGGFQEEQEGEARLLQTVLEFYDAFAARNQTDPRLQLEAARAHRRVGLLRARLEQPAEAEEAFARAIERLDRLEHAPDAPPGSDVELATTLLDAAQLEGEGPSGATRAEARARRGRELLERLVTQVPPPELAAPPAAGGDPRAPQLRPELLVAARSRHAVTLARLGKLEEGEAALAAAIEARDQLPPAREGEWGPQLMVASEVYQAREALADLHLEHAQPAEALALLQATFSELHLDRGGSRGLLGAFGALRGRGLGGIQRLLERLAACHSALGHEEEAQAMKTLAEELQRRTRGGDTRRQGGGRGGRQGREGREPPPEPPGPPPGPD